MNQELKYQIVAGAIAYAEKNDISNNEIARVAGINPSYLSNMLRNNFSNKVDGKDVPIGEKWFYMLAQWAGFAITKAYWKTVPTPQFEKIIYELEIAKHHSRVTTIIVDSGYGKTYTVETFCRINPNHTYKVTVNSMFKIRDILNDIASKIGSPISFTVALTLRDIMLRLAEMKRMGHKPMLIIDEAENLKLPVIQMLKGLYDGLLGYASIVLIGTSQLTDALWKMKQSNRNGVPQFYRRIKAGIKMVTSEKCFAPFFEMHVPDKGLRRLLTNLCDYYGELHDYLEPALKEADEQGVPLTENLFRIIYNMPQ
jgi:DNA transposition AAA+ family ATPase